MFTLFKNVYAIRRTNVNLYFHKWFVSLAIKKKKNKSLWSIKYLIELTYEISRGEWCNFFFYELYLTFIKTQNHNFTVTNNFFITFLLYSHLSCIWFSKLWFIVFGSITIHVIIRLENFFENGIGSRSIHKGSVYNFEIF